MTISGLEFDRVQWLQCPLGFASKGGRYTFCTRAADHNGDHRGIRKQWRDIEGVPTLVPITLPGDIK